ncbi:MAG: DEAD/DEAH box helicase, partial [Acidimicrobiales bacterium]
MDALTSADIDRAVQAHLDHRANEEQLAFLHANEAGWIASLWRHLDAAEDRLDRARKDLRGPLRPTVLADLDADAYRIDAVLTELTGPAPEPAPKHEPTIEVGVTQLQLSWTEGRLVAWAAGPNTEPESHAEVLIRLKEHDGGAISWEERDDITVPGRRTAPTLSAPLASTLGWVAALGADHDEETLGDSAVWMGLATAAAVELVAQGRVVPQLSQFRGGRKGNNPSGVSTYHVRWAPTLVSPSRLAGLVDSVPGAAMACQQDQDRRKFAMSVVSDLADSIVRMAASQLDVPAAPPEPRTRSDVGEAILCRLDGTAFRAPTRIGSEVTRKMSQWADPVAGTNDMRLVIQLSPPDDMGAWHAAVLVPIDKGNLEPVEVTLTTGSTSKAKGVRAQLARVERIFPELLRPGGRRRGEVILSQDEAWQLMTTVGNHLSTAGFDVRVPPLSPRKPTPSLRLTSDDAQETVVGAQQLANVHWSALFDDVELTAADIARLAAEARPLVKSRGQWVELDKVDLAAAAAALAERADQTKLSGADMLRHALGLEGDPLGGGVSLTGDGWAAELLRSVSALPEHPDTQPEGFEGELRSYQADALAWLNFLDNAGLGGCLALDMGLGKTPTTLANLIVSSELGSSLVIAPPAVVGNWAAEAKRFVPDLAVMVHHGPSRLKGAPLKRAIKKADVVITTYGTAVRDMDQLSEIEWVKVVIDEAQAIKNPIAETSQQLRRLNARTRLALT